MLYVKPGSCRVGIAAFFKMFVHKLVICFYMPHHCRGKHDYFTVTAHQISYACRSIAAHGIKNSANSFH